SHRRVVEAPSAGRVTSIDNRVLSRAAKLAGAPNAPAAGVDVHVRLGDNVRAGQPLFTLHAQAPGELAYARQYVEGRPPIFQISEAS
ncbi:MAG: thymidine phosphorylase, partial [Rubrivivax sp.]|nr:thymidine phosphorylase [Rubrivivax sp.]